MLSRPSLAKAHSALEFLCMVVRHANSIVVLDKGHIVEGGSHDDLLKRNTFYARLWGMQEVAT